MPLVIGIVCACGVALAAGAGLVYVALRRRHMQRWLPAYLREAARFRAPEPHEDVHLLLCIADHYEPRAHGADVETGRRRVAAWVERYPPLARFRDSDGRPPRYTFFFPIEEYEKDYLDALAGLCRQGLAEVEIHLHHNHDTAEGLRSKLEAFKHLLANEHGLLARRRDTGELAYAFIHGNWALCNARPDGSWCGVDAELRILLETGCYADLTFPSAPDETQPPILNRIYYARDVPGRPRSHEYALALNGTPAPADALLMVQGPLVLDWTRRRAGVLPAVENACLQGSQPPALTRLPNWLRARVQVPHRPDWFFVKLHAHGAPEDAHEALLGEPMTRFHEDLARLARQNPHFRYHYVTARELVNLIKAAEGGFKGSVADARDWWLVPNKPPVGAAPE